MTVHVGGTFDEVARSEAAVRAGRHAERPFVLLAQPCVVDPTRAPAGKHTLWGYCHVPNGSPVDMCEAMEAQIERFAPGFRDLVLARAGPHGRRGRVGEPEPPGRRRERRGRLAAPDDLPPVARWNPYRTPIEGVYLCSASTPPGGGVHGMCGVAAAEVAVRDRFA